MPPQGDASEVTSPHFDTAEATMVLPNYAGYGYDRYVLGSAEMSGSTIKAAAATSTRRPTSGT
jgi:hypothetical protein